MLKKVEKALNSVRSLKNRSVSRTSSAQRRRFSTSKIEASTFSFYTKEMDCSTINMHAKR